jgi:hypothetical protein
MAGNKEMLCMISGFCCDIDDVCALVRYYAALSSVPMFWDNLWSHFQVPRSPFLALEDAFRRVHLK